MSVLKLAQLVALTALLLTLTARPALADVEASAFGNIADNQITATTIDPATGIATIVGTVTCSTPTQVTVYGWARQLRGMSDRFAEYFGGTGVTCGTTPTRYAVTLTPGYESDRLVPGPASSGTWAEYCANGRCYGMGADTDRPLMPAR